MSHAKLSTKQQIFLSATLTLIGFWTLWKLTQHSSPENTLQGLIPQYSTINSFELYNHHHKRFSPQDIQHKIWMLHTLYNSSHFKNQTLMNRIASLAKAIKKHPKIHIITLLINPESLQHHHHNETFQAFTHKHSESNSQWLFLTTTPSSMQHFIEKELKLMMPHTDTYHSAHEHIFHSEKLILIDQNASIRGYYNIFSLQQITQALEHAKLLSKSSFSTKKH